MAGEPLYLWAAEAVVLRHALMSYRNAIAERRLNLDRRRPWRKPGLAGWLRYRSRWHRLCLNAGWFEDRAL